MHPIVANECTWYCLFDCFSNCISIGSLNDKINLPRGVLLIFTITVTKNNNSHGSCAVCLSHRHCGRFCINITQNCYETVSVE